MLFSFYWNQIKIKAFNNIILILVLCEFLVATLLSLIWIFKIDFFSSPFSSSYNLSVLNYEFSTENTSTWNMFLVERRISIPNISGVLHPVTDSSRSKDLKACLYKRRPEGFTPCSVAVRQHHTHTHTRRTLLLHSHSVWPEHADIWTNTHTHHTHHTHLSAWVRSVAVNNRRPGWGQTVQVQGKHGERLSLKHASHF